MEAPEPVMARLEACLEQNLGRGVISDAAIAHTEQQRRNLWHIRHGVTESNMREGMGLTHDIAVPVFHVPAFLEQADASVTRRYPEARIVVVAHLGDGNLHYIVMLRHEQWASVPDKANAINL